MASRLDSRISGGQRAGFGCLIQFSKARLLFAKLGIFSVGFTGLS
jgi:hypothetical protein